MKEIKASDFTGTFINNLNDNFSNSGGGGSSSSIERTIKVQMQGGMIDAGYTKGNIAANSSSQFFNYCHSVLMMNIEGCSISSVAVESGETLTIFHYGADGSYSGNVSSVANIPSTACYVKFQLYKSSAYNSQRVLSVTVEGNPTFHKNLVPTLVDNKFISFETTMPTRLETLSTDSDYNTYIGNHNRYWDNGYIKLPQNYTMDGKPVPLVVFVHGTGGYSFSSGPSSLYTDLMNFIVNNGYALCDCSGVTNAYSSVANAFAAPSFVVSMTNFVKFIVANYNVDPDRVYVTGKSSGGFLEHNNSLLKGINAKAVGSLAPALSPMVSMSNYCYTNQGKLPSANMMAAQIGVNGEFTLTGTFSSSTANRNLVINNIDKWREIDAFFQDTDLTDAQVATIVNACYDASTSSWHTNISDLSAATSVIATAKKRVYCPTKIWIATDDASVYYGNTELFVGMAQRAGCPCYIRALPSGTGQHHAVDTDTNTIKTTYQTKFAGSVTAPVAYAEMIDWFNRW